MDFRLPWEGDPEESDPAPIECTEPAPEPEKPPKPRGRRPRLDPGLALSAPAAAAGTGWLYHHLTITGPAEAVDAFAAAARGAGVAKTVQVTFAVAWPSLAATS